MGVFKRLFGEIILHLGDMEDEYRRENLSNDIAQCILIAASVAITMLGLLRLDYLMFRARPELFHWMIGYRAAYILIVLATVTILLKARGPKFFDAAVFTWLLLTAIYLILFNFTRPTNYLTTPFDILYPFGAYLLLPLRLKHNFALAAAFSIGTLFVDAFYKTDISSIQLSAALSSQILVHFLGLPAAIQVQSYRRRFFKAYLEQKDAREMANYMINIDTLTKCMTRQYFMETAEKEFVRAKRLQLPLALLMLDIDHFKKINDNHGHHIGDQALQRFAEVVLEQKRAQDVFGRLGGEEFGLLLPNTTLKNAKLAAERIQKIWAHSPISETLESVHSTVSIGVAEISSADCTFNALLQRADNMMYKAKRRGRNRVAIK